MVVNVSFGQEKQFVVGSGTFSTSFIVHKKSIEVEITR
jgi:hypothetical protein